MGRAYLSGFAAPLRRWPLVLVLFLASLVAGLSFTAAAWSWLSVALGKSLATRSLLTDLNIHVFIDLLAHHGESLHVLVFTGSVLAVAFGLLGVWLNAATVVALGEEASTGECLVRGLQLYPTYVGLWALVTLCELATGIVVYLTGRTLTRWMAESPSEMTYYWIVGACALLGILAWLLFATVHDHARVRCVGTDAGALRGFAWAMLFVGRREGRALPLAVLLLATSVAVWALYQAIATLIPTNSALGVTVSLVWGEVLLFARMFLRVWWFGAATHLQQSRESSPYWVPARSDRPAA